MKRYILIIALLICSCHGPSYYQSDRAEQLTDSLLIDAYRRKDSIYESHRWRDSMMVIDSTGVHVVLDVSKMTQFVDTLPMRINQ